MWIVANERRSKFLAFDENGNMFITNKRKGEEIAAFEDMYDAIDSARALYNKFNMSPHNGDDMLIAQLR